MNNYLGGGEHGDHGRNRSLLVCGGIEAPQGKYVAAHSNERAVHHPAGASGHRNGGSVGAKPKKQFVERGSIAGANPGCTGTSGAGEASITSRRI
jgi:hypothetical protein